jgi:threonine synthase
MAMGAASRGVGRVWDYTIQENDASVSRWLMRRFQSTAWGMVNYSLGEILRSTFLSVTLMRYLSTRGDASSPPQTFTEILLGGLAPDGGLFLPESYPQVSTKELTEWRELPYHALALRVLEKFIDDIPACDLKSIVDRSYTATAFRHCRPGQEASDITPLTLLEPGFYLLELSNGPTLAFKDIAMQLLGNLFEYVLAKKGEEINILGATSGDTGSAAEYAMRGKRGVRVFMLSPYGRMSPFQRAQMYSLQDENIYNIAVRGLFDDAQDIVKAVSNDHDFKSQYKIGAVNSINWARVVAQIVYYFKAYFAATQSNEEQVDFAVPSGNFGNVCAGHIARMMGLPIDRLVVATNENDVLDEFFRTGVYRPRSTAETHTTSSPSMDISKASNFERFIFDLVGRDPAVVRELWAKVDAGGSFDLSNTPYFEKLPQFGFVSGTSSHMDRLATIRRTYEQYGVMVDTHTADGLKVAAEWRAPGTPMIVLETALAAKFEETISEALGRLPERPTDLQGIERLPQRVVVMESSVDAVKDFIKQHLDA